MKLCKECKHVYAPPSPYGVAWAFARCMHPMAVRGMDPVEGYKRHELCSVMRRSHKPCGPQAVLWQPSKATTTENCDVVVVSLIFISIMSLLAVVSYNLSP